MDLNDILDRFRGGGDDDDRGSRNRRNRGGDRGNAPNVQQSIWGGSILALIVVVGFACYSSFYRVDASEQGIVLRFGEHVRTVEPGLQIKMPWPIEKVYTVPVRRVQSLEFGFKTLSAGRKTEYQAREAKLDDIADMLTGDLNLAHVEWIVQFKIQDAPDSLFNIGDESSLVGDLMSDLRSNDINPAIPDAIQDISETVMRKLVGDRSVDSVLTMGREEIAAQAKLEIQGMLDEFKAGVEIITVKLQTTSPPEPVKDAFQNVNRARQNKERIVNEAEGERNRQIPAARGKRDQMISEAEGYRERIVMETTGAINAFNAKLAEYEKAPDVTKQRLYLEAMQVILSQVGDKTIIDESVNQMLPILNLNHQPANNPLRGGN
jgi:membrane protease subunit HflK